MEESSKKRIIISGPTACGKSTLALKLAKMHNGEIVNIDSVQVYKDYNIGSAKPDLESQNEIPHHLIDIVSPTAEFNVYDYNNLLLEKLNELDYKHKLPLIVGGSTLYIKTFLEGIANLEGRDQIKLIREELEKESTEKLYDELMELDKEAATNISSNDKFRIVRALELIKTFNLPLSKILKDNMHDSNKNNALILVLCRNRDELHRRINERTEIMINDGLVNEAKELIRKYGDDLRIFKTLGLKEALMNIDGEIDENELLVELSKNTRRYAKRQMTFWRNEPAKNNWDVVQSDTFETCNMENILVNKLQLTQLTDIIKEYIASGELASKVVYLDANYLD